MCGNFFPSWSRPVPSCPGRSYVAASAEDQRYHLPRALAEYRLLASGARKPLVLLALLGEVLAGQQTIVFTSSLDMTRK